MEKKILIGKELKEYKKKLVLNNSQRNLIIGTLLGDSSMEFRLSKPVYAIKFEQKLSSEKYIYHLYNIMNVYVGMIPQIRLIKAKGDFKERKSIWFRTYRHDSFKFYFDLFYRIENNKLKKIIPVNFKKFLNAEVLAYWYMDDGTYAKSGFVLNTQSFTYKENIQLSIALKNKFGFTKVTLWKDRHLYKLYISSSDSNLFIDLIKPYILPYFLYKINL